MSDNIVIEANELVDRMTDDELNRHVDYIRSEYKTRAAKRNAKARAEITIGTRVRIGNRTKPQYLQGQTGEVIDTKNTRILVKLDRGPQGKFRTGNVLCAPGGLEVLED